MKVLIILTMLLVPLASYGAEICDISNDPINADTEESPLKDVDYSEAEVVRSLEGLKIYFEKEDAGDYFIPENYLTIIQGGFLLRRAKLFEKNWIEEQKSSPKYPRWKERAEEAKSDYCQYRKTHFLIDW